MNRTLFTINVTVRKCVIFLLVVLAIVCYLLRYTILRVVNWNSFIEFNPFSDISDVQPRLDAFGLAGIEYEILPSGINDADDAIYIKQKDTDEAQEIVNRLMVDKYAGSGIPVNMHGSMKDLLASRGKDAANSTDSE